MVISNSKKQFKTKLKKLTPSNTTRSMFGFTRKSMQCISAEEIKKTKFILDRYNENEKLKLENLTRKSEKEIAWEDIVLTSDDNLLNQNTFNKDLDENLNKIIRKTVHDDGVQVVSYISKENLKFFEDQKEHINLLNNSKVISNIKAPSICEDMVYNLFDIFL